MKKVAIIGTQGIPANYGGFETLVENIIGDNCSDDIQYTVFCSSKDMPSKIKEHKGARLKYVPLRANGVQSIPYDILSMMRSICGYDTILILGVSGCIFLPVFKLFCRKKVIVNIDGLEYRRAKWKGWVKKFLKFSEKCAVRFANVIITDNKGIQDYVKQEYRKDTTLIAYGGDHALIDIAKERETEILKQYGIEAGGYSMSVCRIEPENNCHMTLEAFKDSNEKLVFIGNWYRNGYSKKLKEEYSGYNNITLLDSIYDLDILYTLRKNTKYYIHGHSAGGTNPSLVEAMFFGRPILSFDVIYNRETTKNKAHYYTNAEDLQQLIHQGVDNGKELKQIACEQYTWAKIAKEYEALY
ncbi:MAG: DUF1972 domain-containing protein [Bacteroidaceae bacterium]|nr:DUF1972 domain-containing protein [Bacteroidaceae bacterium]